MRNYLPIILVFLAAPAWAEGFVLDDPSLPGADRYDRCLGMARQKPEAAYGAALEWRNGKGGSAASHCASVALIGLKRYAEAAVLLNRLAHDVANGDAINRGALFDQAGNAWLLAGRAIDAEQSFTAGLSLVANDPYLLTDRARARAMRQNWTGAEADLSLALVRDGSNPEIFVLRASARHALGRKDDARADIEAALHLKPNYAEALVERGNMKLEAGDKTGARADWQAVLDNSPRGAVAEAARKRIAEVDSTLPAVAKP
jgi:tetratricopeptide (TPR) repeat protein